MELSVSLCKIVRSSVILLLPLLVFAASPLSGKLERMWGAKTLCLGESVNGF
jgi:hypothetical protein